MAAPSLSANVNGFVDESSYFWTTSGDGTFNGSDQNTSTDDKPTYFPGTNDLSTGNVTITADANIDPTKVELALDTGEVSAITWSEIIAGVTMVWTPIDTN